MSVKQFGRVATASWCEAARDRRRHPGLAAGCSAVAGPISATHDGHGAGRPSTSPHAVTFTEKAEQVPSDPAASGDNRAEADATLVRHDNVVTVTVHGKRFAPGLVHAQHIHGVGTMCPTLADDANHDGLVSTPEAANDYGGIVVSLTTTGDMSPSSALAVDRFPVADANGNYTYQRDLVIGQDIPAAVADNLASYEIVAHGIDTNHNGSYDFSKGPSPLDASLPFEATVPASCGPIATHDVGDHDDDNGVTTFTEKAEQVPSDPAASGDNRAEADATLVRHDNVVTVTVHGKRFAPGLVHAQHIHGVGTMCPTLADDANHDGLVSTPEAANDYGGIVVSLTTTGDMSPSSALAVDRFPVADANGNYTYQRDLVIGQDIPAAVADNLASYEIVAHGIDTNHNGSYDFSKGPSPLDASLPFEATVPASCGPITG